MQRLCSVLMVAWIWLLLSLFTLYCTLLESSYAVTLTPGMFY